MDNMETTPSQQADNPASDLTLAEIRAALLSAIIDNAAFDGFGEVAIRAAARQNKDGAIDPDVALLAFSSEAMDKPMRRVFAHNAMARGIITEWFAAVDSAMLVELSTETLAAMKIRERIIALVETRLRILFPHREALRRAFFTLAQPHNLAFAAQLGWRSADVMWQAAGDTARDFNHYSKRAILSTLYSATLLVFLDDDSADQEETRAFLARRIAEVMKFEGWKHRRAARRQEHFSLSRFVGRLRYPNSNR